MVFFVFVDVFYYYLSFNNSYFPDTIIDFMYILSMFIITFGALWKEYKNILFLELSIVMNTGNKRRWIYLLIYPAVAVLFSLTGVVDVKLGFDDTILFVIPTLMYYLSCKYVQISLEKEALLKHSNAMLEQRVAEQINELTFLANKDTLTTLFNRRYFMAFLDESLKSKRIGDQLALLVIDMDRFKTINDSFGHDVGDRVLIELAYRMIEWNNYGATISRLGGDEFGIIFVGKYTQKDVEDLCIEIINLCVKPFLIGEIKLNLSMSIGIALETADICDGKMLMQNADIAMYRAKSQGYNSYQIYDHLMSQDLKRNNEIEFLLKQTDAEKDFELFYQPQYVLPDKKLIGAEALLRWNNSEHGFIPPNVFIPIAEQIDCIINIGKWVMKETIRQSNVWNNKYDFPLKIGFNISPKQFKDKGFISIIKKLIAESSVNTAWIDAEITESIILCDTKNVNFSFSVLRELGITVSIDDFGSGYSALGYLNKYPFDRIKIDKSLIDNVSLRNTSGVNIVKAAINMAHASGIQTIAEGVETQEQLDILIELGCDQAQGFFLGRPVTANVFEKRFIEMNNNDII
jgi:diguanylate cyclase (GGDEF)-like protein